MSTAMTWMQWAHGNFLDDRKFLLGECPPLANLCNVHQDPVHHPEGTALEHSIWVIRAANEIASREGILGRDRVALMLAAMLHDVGKAVTTRWDEKKAKWTAYGHDEAGVGVAAPWLTTLYWIEDEELDRVLTLIRFHMVHVRPESQVTDKAVKKLLSRLEESRVSWKELFWLMEADCSGRPPIPPGFSQTAQRFNEAIARLAPGQEVDLSNWRPVVL